MRKFIAQLSDNKKAFFIFLFLLGAVFSRVIVNQQTFFSDVIGLPFRGGAHHYDGPKTFWDLDATNYMHFEVPQTIYWMTELQKGNFAFWNPYQGNGQPLSASITSGIYNPLKLALFFLFPYMKTFDFYLLLRFLIAGFGTYLFLKNRVIPSKLVAWWYRVYVFRLFRAVDHSLEPWRGHDDALSAFGGRTTT